MVYVFTLFRVAVGLKFGKPVAFWLTMLTLTQFHFAFYLTRPLPNVFALIPLLLALHSWLVGNEKHFIWQVIAVFEAPLFLSFLLHQPNCDVNQFSFLPSQVFHPSFGSSLYPFILLLT